MRILSKSKLMAFRQCPKRLWLEVNRLELRKDSAATQASFSVGHQVGDIAQQLYDPDSRGIVIDPQSEGFDAAFARTQQLLQSPQPIFEAGFRANGALAFADIMLPVEEGSQHAWRMVEVKSSTSVKNYHYDDAAVQGYIARASNVSLKSIALAHIDSSWVYPGGGDYQGILKEQDLTEMVFHRGDEVSQWINQAQQILATDKEPEIETGNQCSQPFECGFYAYCSSQEPQAEHPLSWLPSRYSGKLSKYIEANKVIELRDLPDAVLNDKQNRVKNASITGEVYFNRKGAAKDLVEHKLPAYFMDFETIQFAVPIWKGTRPYQQIPFQFSVHLLSEKGHLEQQGFLDLSGGDPSESFAQSLINTCGESGPIFVYNAAFETSRIRDLAERLPHLAQPLLALNTRVVDLLPVAREHYYHPNQKGSWSIKAVLPALCPDLSYADLEGVKDGGMAMDAFMEALAPQTSAERKKEIETQLLRYCELDTFAMVRLWSEFSGKALS